MKTDWRFISILFIIFFLSVSFASAQSDDNQTLTANAGSFSDLRDEIYSADEGDTIILERDYEWQEDDGDTGIPIYNYVKNITIDGNGHYIDAKQSVRIFFINEGADNIAIKNVIFKNGNSNGGGAILWRGDNGVLENNQFISNTASNIGGALYLDAPNARLTGNYFYNNKALTQSGGAIYISQKATNIAVSDNRFDRNDAATCGAGIGWSKAQGTLTNNVFTNNHVGESGAALYYNGENGKIFNNTFTGNVADGSGGAIYLECNGVEFSQNTLTDNYANTGGAMRWKGDRGTATNNIYSNNRAGNNGGAMFWNGNDAVLKNNIFTTNVAQSTAAGALLFNGNNNQLISNSFTSNTAATYGGAMYTTGSNNRLESNTFSKNTAGKSGGALYFDGASGTVTKNRFIDNTGSGVGAIRWEGNSATVSENTFSGNTNGNVIYGDGSSATVSSNTFLNSKATDNCIRWNSGDARITGNIYKEGTPIDDSVVTLVCQDLTKYYGGQQRLEVTLLDKNGVGIANVDVIIHINGVSNIRTTNDNGKTSIGINLNPSEYATKITVSRYGLEKNIKVTVKSTVEGQDTRGEYGSARYTAKFLDSNGAALSNTNVQFNIEGKLYSAATNANGQASLNLDLNCGNYVITTINPATGETIANNAYIYQRDSNTTLTAKQTGGSIKLTAKINSSSAGGKVIFTKDNDNYEAEAKNGEAVLYLTDLTPGEYHATARYLGDVNHRPSDSEYIRFNVSEYEVFLITYNVSKYYGGSERLEVTLLDNNKNPVEHATVLIELNGVNMTRTTQANGKTTVAINLNCGNYTSKITVPQYNLSDTANIEVKTTITADDVDKIEKAPEQFVATLKDNTGKLLTSGKAKFNINGVMYERNINSQGQAKLNLNLGPNTYIITTYNPETKEQSANTVKINSRFANHSDVTKYYRNSTQYYITIIGDDKNPVGKGEVVTFNINGVFYNRTTNENGTAKLNINLYTGDYILTAIYKGCMVSDSIKVLPILTAKDITLSYRDGTQFRATLVNGEGKPIVNETVTFNINGVFYNRTTKAGGVASLNINLIPGEYIITSFYGQFAIANTIIIKSQ
ncbi:right-handed parallel beta-helix repeat-containing protein [Methanobrevibacter sp.]|uniref:right-handed parallel beta-helix repeat-containing protein n=1 Tax=Methanobrevibacter sp. TaxID=66852 RepID=UPI003890E889